MKQATVRVPTPSSWLTPNTNSLTFSTVASGTCLTINKVSCILRPCFISLFLCLKGKRIPYLEICFPSNPQEWKLFILPDCIHFSTFLRQMPLPYSEAQNYEGNIAIPPSMYPSSKYVLVPAMCQTI